MSRRNYLRVDDSPIVLRAAGAQGKIALVTKADAVPAEATQSIAADTLPSALLGRLWTLLRKLIAALPRVNALQRNLELVEMRPLGDRRFVAIVRAEERRFLIGGAGASLSLLSEIGEPAARPRSAEKRL